MKQAHFYRKTYTSSSTLMNKPLSYPGGEKTPKNPFSFVLWFIFMALRASNCICPVRWGVKSSLISLPSGLCSLHCDSFAKAMEPAHTALGTGKQLLHQGVPAGMGLKCCLHPHSSPLLLPEWQSKLQTQPVGSRGASRAADRWIYPTHKTLKTRRGLVFSPSLC